MPATKGIIEPSTGDIHHDLIDRKLIAALSHNVRFSPSFLGKLVSLSKDGVRYRLERLSKNRTLIGTLLMVNPWVFGYSVSMLAFDFKQSSIRQEEELLSKLAGHPMTLWVAKSHGVWNAVVYFVYRTKGEHDAVRSLIRPFSQKIAQAEVQAFHRYDVLPRWFLAEQSMEQIPVKRLDSAFQKYIHKPRIGAVQSLDYDIKDRQIIIQLADDCRASIASLSKNSGIPFNTVKNRLKKMVKHGLIASFSPLLNVSLLKMIIYSCYITAGEKVKPALISYLKGHPNSGWVLETKGPWNIVWYGGVKSMWDLNKDLDELRNKFPAIEHIITSVVARDYKLSFMPQGMIGHLSKNI